MFCMFSIIDSHFEVSDLIMLKVSFSLCTIVICPVPNRNHGSVNGKVHQHCFSLVTL